MQFHGEQDRLESCCLRHSARLSRSAGVLSQRTTRRWALFCAGCGRTPQCEWLDDCGLVQHWNTRKCSSGNPWTALDHADSRDHRRAAQARSTTLETTGFSSAPAKYATVECGGSDQPIPSGNAIPKASRKEGSMNEPSGFPAASTCGWLSVCRLFALVWLSRGSSGRDNQPAFPWLLAF